MNLEALKKRNAEVTTKEWRGENIYLRKIGAQDGLRLLALVKTEADKPRTTAEDHAATVDYHAQVISKSLSNEQGALELDTDAGLAELKKLAFDELVELGELCLRHSGFVGNQKKSTVTTNSSPTTSAENSESPTLTSSL